MPFYGAVEAESVLFLTRSKALRIPTPPTMVNERNLIASVSQLGRWLAEEAEELGVTILPETSAAKLLVDGGRVVGVRTGDRGRGRQGEELGNFEPGSDVTARVTILAEGTQGHLTGAALERFGLSGESPQVWALGVKEVWKVAKPLDRVIHTMGWPLRGGAKFREFGGSFIYPMGEEHVSIGMVVGLDYRDAELSVHDLLQELKTHPRIRRILDGRRACAVGREDDSGGRVRRAARAVPCAGAAAVRRRRRPGERAGAEGHSLRDRVGPPGGRGGVADARGGRVDARGARVVRHVAPGVVHLERPARGAEHAAGVRPRLLGRRRAGGRDDGDEGQVPAGRRRRPSATRRRR